MDAPAMSMDIADWLRGLGLEQYVQLFRDNDIDGDILGGMNAEDLKELGISSFGHRRKLLHAISALRGAPATRDVAQSALSVTSAPVSSPTIDAERRQLTVMFCDLVGSTPLSTRFDPEDLREIVGAYHRCVADTVARFAGFVAKYMGDGVLVYFGYPEAHEDDAERAVRTGLAVIDAVGRLATPEPLSVRLGVASGLVVVGDLIGAGAAQERGVVGETPNLAARLQAVAQPGTLVIADSTRRQIGTLFEIEDLGPQPLAGFAEPQRAWRVVGESGVVSRFEALRSGTTPLVGRDEELDLLLRRWQQAKLGEGRVVLVSGEPGIGKSRLTAALSQRIESEPHTRLRYFCSPHHQDSALHPFIGRLERAAGFARDDTAGTKLDKLEGLLGEGTEPSDISLIAEMLSLSGGERFPPLDLSPQRKKERTMAALLRQLQALARRQPILMIFEDLHWIDPTSRELLDLTVEKTLDLPVLLVATYRPEFQPPWVGQSQVTVITLNRLGRNEGATLVARLASNLGALPPDVVDEIVERTDGVPLFVEELTKAVVEANADCGHGSISAVSPSSLAVPATLHASLLGRLDRLGPIAKEVAQIGALIGREFGFDLIELVARRPMAVLQQALDRLVTAELLFCRGEPPRSSYLFKHALVRDAADSTLLRGARRKWHREIAEAIATNFPEMIATQPEILALHYAQAGEAIKAASYWLDAGRHAAQRSANIEAIAHFKNGIEVLQSSPATPERDRQEVALQLALGPALQATHGWSAPGIESVYQRAQGLCEQLADDRQWFNATWGLWFVRAGDGAWEAASELVDNLIRVAQRLDDPGFRLQAHHAGWGTSINIGEHRTAREHVRRGLALHDPKLHSAHALIYGGHDPKVCAKGQGALCLWLLGYPDQAAQSAGEAVTLGEVLSHPPSLAHALLWAALVHQLRRNPQPVNGYAQRLRVLATEHKLALYTAIGRIMRGWALCYEGQSEFGLHELSGGIEAYAAARVRLNLAHFTAVSAEAYHYAGKVGHGLAAIEHAVSLLHLAEHWCQSGILQLKGEILISSAPDHRTEAESCFQEALQIARRQGAKSAELRAATSLARLWGKHDRRGEARDLLAPVYSWFTEGFDTADLKEAKRVLDELA
jgi:class 3 adenylate cyclase/predicted ATPase